MGTQAIQNGSGSDHSIARETSFATDFQCDTKDSIAGWDTPESTPIDQNCTFEGDKLESIAVIGFSSKFPQEGTTPEAFWEMLLNKKCAMTEWPEDRLNVDAFYHPDSSRPDTVQYPLRIASTPLRTPLRNPGAASIQRWPFPRGTTGQF